MRRILLPTALLFISFFSLNVNKVAAQFVNDGAAITIQSGAFIFCAGNFENKNAGTVTNNGKLEVQGNFLNTATYTTTTADDSLILSGGGNVTLNGGASLLTNLWINKTAAVNFVTLTGTTLLTGKLDYDQGTFTTDPIANPAFLFSAPTTAVFDFAAGKEIIGKVRRTGWTNGSLHIFNQPNMQVTTTAGTAPTDFTVTMIPQSGGGDPSLAEREVKRKFQFAHTGGTGFVTDIRYPYLDAELNTNLEPTLYPWQLITAEWNGRLAPVTRDGAVNFVATTGLTVAELANEWKLADARYTMNATAHLRGPFNTGTGLMNTALNSGGIIPLGQPYNTTPFNYTGTESVGAIPNANVVDWILVELRKPASGAAIDATSATIIGRKAGFLLNNGTPVELDGVTPIAFEISKQGAAFMVIRHRNHLGVMSNSLPSNATGSFTNNFTVLANSYKNPAAASDPVILLTGTTYGLWAGDANKSGNLAASDINAIKVAIANSSTGYLFTDVNMTANIALSDINLVKLMISNSGTGSTPARPGGSIKTNIPDGIGPDQ